MYTFVNRYAHHPVRLTIPVGDGDKTILEKVVFQNAVFQTEDEAIANALRNHPHFGMDWNERSEIKEKANKYKHADDKSLFDQLNSLTIFQLRNIAFEKKIGVYSNVPEGQKSLRVMKKNELIDRMIEKKHLLGEYFME